MFLRKIGKLLRGQATPFQILSATLLGSLLGAAPGFGQAPLLIALLLTALIVLNANLFLAAIVLVGVKLLSLLLMPLHFHVGVFLLEGPLQEPVALLVNAPVTAWFGLEYYVTLPALLLAGLIGLILGVAINRSLRRFRKKMATLETDSPRYQALSGKIWVRILAWIFIGGLKGKKSWQELSESSKGLPVRPLGIVSIVLLGVLLFIGTRFLDTAIITSYARSYLEQLNGATVDLSGVSVNPGEGKVTVDGLAFADPAALDENRFAADSVILNISGLRLLSKKLEMDTVEFVDASSSTPRRVRGQLTREVVEPEPVPPAAEGDINIWEYLEQAEVWRERLAAAKRLYDRLAPYLEKDDAPTDEGGLTWKEKLEIRAREGGWASVMSESLVRGKPRLVIRELKALQIEVGGHDDRFALIGENLSSHPSLIEEGGRLLLRREDGRAEVVLSLPSATEPATSGLALSFSGIEVSKLEEETGKDLPVSGGTLAIKADGRIDSGVLDLPVEVRFSGSTLTAFGGALSLDGVPIGLQVYGTLDNPKVALPKDALEQAVKAGGMKKVENLLKETLGDDVKKFLPFGGGE